MRYEHPRLGFSIDYDEQSEALGAVAASLAPPTACVPRARAGRPPSMRRMSVFSRIMRFAQSPRGRRMVSDAGRYARSPQARRQFDSVRRQLAQRRRGRPR
jgi:hypothetical protein